MWRFAVRGRSEIWTHYPEWDREGRIHDLVDDTDLYDQLWGLLSLCFCPQNLGFHQLSKKFPNTITNRVEQMKEVVSFVFPATYYKGKIKAMMFKKQEIVVWIIFFLH